MKLKTNMSKTDQKIRAVLGCIFVTIAITEIVFTDPMSRALIGIVGAMAVFSAITRYCMLYELTGFGTTPSASE